MNDPNVHVKYEYVNGVLMVTTDTGQAFNLQGESAERFAESVQIDDESGRFAVSENDWNDLARGSFRG